MAIGISNVGFGLGSLSNTQRLLGNNFRNLASIDSAIASVSSTRASLGSVQNRMESTIRNLRVGIENTTAANSRIRDTDLASETSKLAKNRVLARAGIAVKMQANLQSKSVLQLLGRAG